MDTDAWKKGGRAMIWCVEDDEGIREIEVYTLRSVGMDAKGFPDGKSFRAALEKEAHPELVLLDIMLPGEDGASLLRFLRADPRFSSIPVIMATAKGTEFDKIQGLDAGADDYLVKPFGMMEMVSRVKAVLRRCAPAQKKALCSGGLTLDEDAHTVTIDGRRIELTFKEYELLRVFMKNPGVAFTRDRLFNEIWGAEFLGETRTVDMHIRTLRQKLGEYGGRIETVRGVGYRFGCSFDAPEGGTK